MKYPLKTMTLSITNYKILMNFWKYSWKLPYGLLQPQRLISILLLLTADFLREESGIDEHYVENTRIRFLSKSNCFSQKWKYCQNIVVIQNSHILFCLFFSGVRIEVKTLLLLYCWASFPGSQRHLLKWTSCVTAQKWKGLFHKMNQIK